MLADGDDDPEIQQLAIPIQPLVEELTCPICFNGIKECYMTPCGHNFCSGCILECVNRKHSCPCCNKPTIKENLVKNHHVDRLVTLVNLHKEESSRKYFESIINGKTQINGTDKQSNNNSTNQPRQLSPIESLFQKHMKRSLASYEEYYRVLQTQHLETVAKLQAEYAKRMAIAPQDHRDALMRECSAKTTESATAFEHAISLLMNSYDSYPVFV